MKSKDRTVSAIIPCFNQGQFVEEAVLSLLNQTSRIDEIIIIDDGSTDPETVAILDRVSWPRTTVLRTANHGVSAARNHGIRASQGKYLLNLDADDYLAPTFVEQAVEILEKDSHAGAVGSWIQLFGTRDTLWQPTGGEARDFLSANQSGPNDLFRRTFWQDAGGYDESMRFGFEDWEFWLSGCSKGWSVCILPEALCHYRKKEGSSGLTSAYEHKPEIVAYMVTKHLSLYQNHICQVITEKERLIDRIYHSPNYLLGVKASGKPHPLS